jgi:GNAT superfamily N-acetyltransferase
VEVVDRYGLALALIGPEELDGAPWEAAGTRPDVVRMLRPPPGVLPELARRGFWHKPATVTWRAPLERDEETFLARLGRDARRDVRRVRRRVAAAGLREVVEEPVSPRTLDRFLALYGERVAGMRFGVPFALAQREAILDGPQKFCGVFAHAPDGGLAGGVLVLERPELDAAVLRFSAVTAEWRRHSLARALYLTALETARSKGYRWGTLGNEPNLMGHLTGPGLFHFKAGLGFRPVPSQDFGDPDGHDEADLVLRLTALSDPSMILAYAPEAGDRALAARVISHGPVDTAPFTAPFLAGTTVCPPGGAGPAPGTAPGAG